MWKITQIFDGDYGCEERLPGQSPKLSITLEDETGNIRYTAAEDAWLRDNNLDEGSIWPENQE